MINILQQKANFQIIYDDAFDIYYCMSYGHMVATYSERDGYEEYTGEKYNSRTSVKHKNLFKRYLEI